MKTLVSFVLILLCGAIVSAQERVIPKSEFDAAVADANGHHLKWKGETYRMTVTTSAKTAGRPQTDWSSKMLFEYGPDSAFRSVSTSVFGEKPNKTTESMRIGKWIYTRSGDDPWKRKEYAPSDAPKRPETESPTQVIGTTAEYKHVGSATLADKPVQIYVRTERQSKVSKQTGTTIETDIRATYWIGADGTLLKNEYSSESRASHGVSQTLIVTTWERDPSIKFTEPEVASL